MKNYLDCKKVDTAISRAKKMLIQKAANSGIYECFGQKEVREIKDKFFDSTDFSDEMRKTVNAIDHFDNWCSTYTGSN